MGEVRDAVLTQDNGGQMLRIEGPPEVKSSECHWESRVGVWRLLLCNSENQTWRFKVLHSNINPSS
jgi:hypothetical protein